MVTALLLANGYFISKIIHCLGIININQLHQIHFYYDSDHALIRATVILVISTLMSLLITFLTKPVDNDRLLAFYKRVKPMGCWKPIALQAPEIVIPKVAKTSWLGFGFGVIFLNSVLFSVGHLILGHYLIAFFLLVIAIIFGRMTLHQVENTTTE
jgi:SSS family solute:Na+ symporter